jgi:hypothetical protein
VQYCCCRVHMAGSTLSHERHPVCVPLRSHLMAITIAANEVKGKPLTNSENSSVSGARRRYWRLEFSKKINRTCLEEAVRPRPIDYADLKRSAPSDQGRRKAPHSAD